MAGTVAVFGLASRLLGGLASRGTVPINLVISNVPGPPIEGAGLNITVLSYVDRIDWGFIACRELAPRLQDMAHAVEDAHQALLKRAS